MNAKPSRAEFFLHGRPLYTFKERQPTKTFLMFLGDDVYRTDLDTYRALGGPLSGKWRYERGIEPGVYPTMAEWESDSPRGRLWEPVSVLRAGWVRRKDREDEMKEEFVAKKFRPASMELLAFCETVIERYTAQGLKLTLRQLYYQCVSRNVITNEEKSYKNLGSLVSDGRLAGLLDWDAIEDRVRVPRIQNEWHDPAALIESAIRQFRLPRWADQATYVELWVEKDALAGVLEPLAREFHVTMMVNRGYSSSSAMYEAANRFMERGDGKDCYLLYLGDHDPSGEDMVRDVSDRLHLFGADVVVKKLALTMEQIEEHKPPPNPAKLSDSRAAAYVRLHGASSWEVDALPPETLQGLIREGIEAHFDRDAYEAVEAQEVADKKALRKMSERFKR